jgi:hypothetical protein
MEWEIDILLDAKVYDKKRWWPVLKCYPVTGTEGLRKKKGSQDCTPQDKESYPEFSECEAEALICQLYINPKSKNLLHQLVVKNQSCYACYMRNLSLSLTFSSWVNNTRVYSNTRAVLRSVTLGFRSVQVIRPYQLEYILLRSLL